VYIAKEGTGELHSELTDYLVKSKSTDTEEEPQRKFMYVLFFT